MLVLFPFIFLFSLGVLLKRHCALGWRVSMLASASLTSAYMIMATEILSFGRHLSLLPLLMVWLLPTLLLLGRAMPQIPSVFSRFTWPRPNGNEMMYLIMIGFILAVTLTTAVISAPNTYDAMTYHLARVEHWIQNRGVANYPTHIIRQLYITPWAEYALTQARILCHWDGIVNLLQWASMLGSLVCVSLIVEQLGGGARAQILGCLAAAALPMGLLQSVSTQTDYVTAFWFLSFVFFILKLSKKFSFTFAITSGLTLGTAFLTKGYPYIICIPFLVWFVAAARFSKLKACASLLFILLLSLALNFGFFHRNMKDFGAPAIRQKVLLNSSLDVQSVVGNALRNFSLHLDTPFPAINRMLVTLLNHAAHVFGVDLFGLHGVYNDAVLAVPDFSKREDYAGNCLHLIMFLSVFALMWFNFKQSRGLKTYAVLIIGAGLLLSSLLRFQVWDSRFHLVLFLLFCPVFGVFCDRLWGPKEGVVLAGLMMLNALPFLFFNAQHPWEGPQSIWTLPREKQYFIGETGLLAQTKKTALQVRAMRCADVGLILGEDDWEYPFWVLLKNQDPQIAWRIEHVMVKNESSGISYPLGDFHPCAVAGLRPMTKT